MSKAIIPPPPQPTTVELRDHFAALALMGLLASDEVESAVFSNNPALNGHLHLAMTSYRLGDAMLQARKAVSRG
jgi:hypothetical protein